MFLLALVVWLAAEIATLVVVAGQIGWLLAVILFIGISTLGPWLVRRAGIDTIDHARRRMQAGALPDLEILDGVVALIGGILVCIPGFLGDVVGLLLQLRPVRRLVFAVIGHRLARQVRSGTLGAWGTARRPGSGPVIDAGSHRPDTATDDDPIATQHEIEDGPGPEATRPPQ